MIKRSSVAAVALVAAAVAAGCGGDDGGSDSPSGDAKPVGPESAGSVVQYADCKDWQGGARAERYATVEALRRQLTAQGSKDTRSPLADDRAVELLDKTCANQASASLRLYKLYVRMQGFAPLRD